MVTVQCKRRCDRLSTIRRNESRDTISNQVWCPIDSPHFISESIPHALCLRWPLYYARTQSRCRKPIDGRRCNPFPYL